MTKKESAITVFLVICIGLVCAGGYAAWVYFNSDDTTQADTRNVKKASTKKSNNNNVPLDNSNALPLSTNELGQIGGASPTNSSENTPTATATTPESFAQYEQFKDSTDALYADIQKGTGKAIEAGSKVAIFYKGWLTDGTLFDQSRKGEDGNLQPFLFTIGAREVIPGMEQAIFGMKTGGTRRLIIPPTVGYGEQGQEKIIPPNSVLVFDVQLLAVQ